MITLLSFITIKHKEVSMKYVLKLCAILICVTLLHANNIVHWHIDGKGNRIGIQKNI